MLLLVWRFFAPTGTLKIQAISIVFSTQSKMRWLKADWELTHRKMCILFPVCQFCAGCEEGRRLPHKLKPCSQSTLVRA